MKTCYPCYVEERNTYEDFAVDADHITEVVAQVCSVSIPSMISKSRKRGTVLARQISMALIRRHTALSLECIGEHFGNRDHTTVIHSIATIKDLLETDESTRRIFTQSCRDLGIQFDLPQWIAHKPKRSDPIIRHIVPTRYSNKSAYGIAR